MKLDLIFQIGHKERKEWVDMSITAMAVTLGVALIFIFWLMIKMIEAQV
jgi:hypothetical protein